MSTSIRRQTRNGTKRKEVEEIQPVEDERKQMQTAEDEQRTNIDHGASDEDDEDRMVECDDPSEASELAEAERAQSAQKRSKIHSKNAISCTHPRGVKPLGNQLFEGKPSIRGGFGLLGSAFTDTHLLDLLRTHLFGEDLVILNHVSKAFYILSNEEELWREMVLNRWEGSFEFHLDWKNTFSFMAAKEKGKSDSWRPLPKPIKFDGFYSDEVFQAFYCAHIDLPGSFDNVEDNIPRIHYKDLSAERFKKEFGIPNRPLIITGLMDDWACYSTDPKHNDVRWTEANWKRLYGDKPFKIGRFVMPLDKYFQYMNQIQSDESPLYLFDSKFGDKHPELLAQYAVPEYFQHDYFDLLNDDPKVRPAFRWILVGPERSGSTFHKDPNHTSAWNGLISGKKKWIMYPIEQTPPGVIPSQDGAEVATPISVAEWFINNYAEHRRRVEEYKEQTAYAHQQRVRKAAMESKKQLSNEPPQKKLKTHPSTVASSDSSTSSSSLLDPPGPVEATCQPGEIIFIPNGWWHTALNLTPSFAVTQNYVNKENIWNVCDFLASDEGERERNLTLLAALEAKLAVEHPDISSMVEEKKIQKEIERSEREEEENRKKNKKKSSLWERLTS